MAEPTDGAGDCHVSAVTGFRCGVEPAVLQEVSRLGARASHLDHRGDASTTRKWAHLDHRGKGGQVVGEGRQGPWVKHPLLRKGRN